MPFHESATGRFYYRRWSAEEANASLVFLHGYGEHSGHYHRFAGQLAAAGIDVWMPDHAGHGLTGPRDGRFGSVERLADAAVELALLARAQAPDLPLVIGGHSLGGLAATIAAPRLEPPPRGLVVTGTPFDGLPPEAVELDDPVMSLDPAYLDALEHDPLGFDAAAGEDELWRVVDATRPRLEAAAASLAVPVLMVNGEHDVFAPPPVAQRWQQRFVDATSTIVPGGHHDIPNDASHWSVARTVADAVRSWTSTTDN